MNCLSLTVHERTDGLCQQRRTRSLDDNIDLGVMFGSSCSAAERRKRSIATVDWRQRSTKPAASTACTPLRQTAVFTVHELLFMKKSYPLKMVKVRRRICCLSDAVWPSFSTGSGSSPRSRTLVCSHTAVRVVGDWGYQDKGLFPPKPSRRDFLISMFYSQSVTFWYPTSSPNSVL